MYVNGRRSLGYVIKNNTAPHTWPLAVRRFLHPEARVVMDARRMGSDEIDELSDLTTERVLYSTPLVWKTARPAEEDMVISATAPDGGESSVYLKVVVTRLHPKWCVATHDSKGDVFVKVCDVFMKGAVLKESSDSLIDHLVLGDTLAIHCKADNDDYLSITEVARSSPGFEGSTASLKFVASLAWDPTAEVDPHAQRDKRGGEEGDACDFLATSSALSKQLPAEREAEHKAWPGIIEEVHLPSGGIVLLDKSLGLDEGQRRVYFHRSRLSLNGARISTGTDLRAELVPGDPVTVDVVRNRDVVDAETAWVAVAIHCNNRARGLRIAKALRTEVVWSDREGIVQAFANVANEINETICDSLYRRCDIVAVTSTGSTALCRAPSAAEKMTSTSGEWFTSTVRPTSRARPPRAWRSSIRAPTLDNGSSSRGGSAPPSACRWQRPTWPGS